MLSALSSQVVFFQGTHGSCDEFAHIHFKGPSALSSDSKVIKSSDHENAEDDCHEGKSIFAYKVSLFSSIDFFVQISNEDYELVFSSENHFKSPYLEPHRKPPKRI